MTRKSPQLEQRLGKALSHPLRMRALTLLNQRVASPSELAEELGEPLGNVSYHVRMLLELDLIELVRTTPRRGAVEHHYRATERAWLDKREWGELPRSLRRGLSDAVLAQIWKDTLAAAKEGTLDARDSRHVSRTPLVLDEKGWSELAEVLDEVLERALAIQSESAERLSNDTDADPIEGRLVLMHYEAPPEAGRRRPAKRKASNRRK
jgi:DNA-binding transcriptional ArsR family regulator